VTQLRLILGKILNPISDSSIKYYPDGLLVLEKVKAEEYKVVKITRSSEINKYKGEIFDFSDRVIIPSFFDMHFHWVQDDVRQMPKDSLLDWLDKYTFPTEAKFKNKTFSRKEAKHFFKRLVKVGTLGGACFSSVHEHALDDAFENCIGDFVIGNVLMTMNSPKSLIQTKDEAKKTVDNGFKKYKNKYAVTPRFAIATDPETMKYGHEKARKRKAFIQSHLSENKAEIEFVLDIYKNMKGFERVETYTDIYDQVNGLGPQTLMAHGIHLSSKELTKLARTKTSIIHCPTSNAPTKKLGLGSGLFDFKQVEKHKVRWALGSDIGGGPYLSMFDVMQSFVAQNNSKDATYSKALFRSTLMGAKILGIEKTHGNLQRNKWGNLLVLSKIKTYQDDCPEKILKRICHKYRNSREKYDTLVENVFYKGKMI